MNFKGKVTNIGPVQQAGNYQKQEIEFTTDGEYPNSIVITFFGDYGLKMSDDIDLNDIVDIEYNSKVSDYNDRKYNNLTAWKIRSIDKSSDLFAEDTPF